MSRPTKQQIAAATSILADLWDTDGTKAFRDFAAYREWGAGIADIIIHDPPPETLVEYLGVLEEQLGLPQSTLEQRQSLAASLEVAVREQAG